MAASPVSHSTKVTRVPFASKDTDTDPDPHTHTHQMGMCQQRRRRGNAQNVGFCMPILKMAATLFGKEQPKINHSFEWVHHLETDLKPSHPLPTSDFRLPALPDRPACGACKPSAPVARDNLHFWARTGCLLDHRTVFLSVDLPNLKKTIW